MKKLDVFEDHITFLHMVKIFVLNIPAIIIHLLHGEDIDITIEKHE